MSITGEDFEKRIRTLESELKRIRENEMPHLVERLEKFESANRKSARKELLGLAMMLWVATPIAFLSIPLVGIACALTAAISTIGYARGRAFVE